MELRKYVKGGTDLLPLTVADIHSLGLNSRNLNNKQND
jgi:hypothetical protein